MTLEYVMVKGPDIAHVYRDGHYFGSIGRLQFTSDKTYHYAQPFCTAVFYGPPNMVISNYVEPKRVAEHYEKLARLDMMPF